MIARRKGRWGLGGGGQSGREIGTSVIVSKIKIKLIKRESHRVMLECKNDQGKCEQGKAIEISLWTSRME